MGAFEYTALDDRGKQRKGVLEGDTPRSVRQQLREKGFSPLSVVEVRQREQKRSAKGAFSFQRGISNADLALLTRQFSTLVRSGLPLDVVLKAVSQQTEKPRIRNMILGVRARVLEGHTLAHALDDFPHVFPEIYRSTILAGEQSGKLDVVLERLADYTENRQALAQKTSVALIYPIFLVVASLAIVIALLAYVVPQVVQVFSDMGADLPVLTVILIAVSDFILSYGVAMAIGLALSVLLFSMLIRQPGPKRYFHRFLLKLPVVGRLLRGLNAARFSQTMSILVASGVPVLDGLNISASVLTNLPMRLAVEDAATMVREGTGISVALEKSGYFPPMTIHLIASGEASGNLEEMLERAATSQEREVETLISAFMGILEPLMLLIMGGVVLMIVLAILMPIFEMNTMIK